MKRRRLMLTIVLAAATVLTAAGVLTALAATREGSSPAPATTAPAQEAQSDEHPWLGVEVVNSVDGVLVAGVVPDSPAAKAGVKRGDIVTQVAGSAVSNARELREKLQGAQVGQTLALTLKRDGTTTTVNVTLAARPKPPKPPAGLRLGILVEERDGQVVIIGVLPETPAHKGGLQRGDVVLAVGDKSVTTVAQLREALAGAQPGSTVAVKVRRGAQEQTVQVTLPEQPLRKGLLHRLRGGLFGLPLLGGLLPELQGLGPKELLERFLGAQFQFTDKDGKPLTINTVVGKLQSISASNVAVEGKGSFPLAGDAVLIRQGQRAQPGDFQAGEQVAVVTVNGQARLVTSPPALGAGLRPHRGPFRILGEGQGHIKPRMGPQ